MTIKLSDPAEDIYLDGRVKETSVLEAVDAASQEMLAKFDDLIQVPKWEGPPATMRVILRSTPLKAVNPLIRWANPMDIKAGDRIVIGVDGALKPDGPGQSYVVQSVDTRGYGVGGWEGRWHTFSMGCRVHEEPCGLCKKEYLGAFAGLKDREDALFSREDIERAKKAGVRMTDKQFNDALRMLRPPTGRVIEDPIVRLENWLGDFPVTERVRFDARDRFPLRQRGGMKRDLLDDMLFVDAIAPAAPKEKKDP